jgi:hypothetical protein
VSGWERVIGTVSASNSSSPKTAAANCTAGKNVIGGGYVLAASGDVSKLSVVSNWPSDGDTWSVTVREDVSLFTPAGNWTVQAYAICITAP